MNGVYASAILLITLIALALGVPALVKRSRTPKVAKDDTPAKPDKKTVEKVKSDDGPSWARPILLFIFFWGVLLWFYPSTRDFVWDSAGRWVCIGFSAGYFLLAFLGRNMRNLRGKRETPVHQILVGWAITILFLIGGGRELVGYILRRMSMGNHMEQTVAVQKKATSNAKTSVAAKAATKNEENAEESLSKTIVVDYGYMTPLVIPDSYVVDSVDDSRVEWQNAEHEDGGTVVNFFTRQESSVTTTVHCKKN